MLVAIGLVYMIMVILFRSLLVLLVNLCAQPLVVIGGFVSLAATGRALDLSALIGLLMRSGIVVTNATVLLDDRRGDDPGLDPAAARRRRDQDRGRQS
jgi:HAE1 family hydrophobic/amphiphilic exporter-1